MHYAQNAPLEAVDLGFLSVDQAEWFLNEVQSSLQEKFDSEISVGVMYNRMEL